MSINQSAVERVLEALPQPMPREGNGNGSYAPVEAADGDLFQRYTATELLAMPRTFEWLVRRMLVHPTYGQIAGELKTLKSYVALMIYIGIASGTPILDTFDVAEAAPVVTYIGEGGRVPYTRRLERVAAAMGVDLDGVPLHFSFDVAPIGSSVFMESMRRDLGEIGPVLLGIDPYYAYHGTATKASDLHQEGALLSSISAPCVEAGCTLLVNNHFNQTGTGNGLSRITQAGSGEWVDSWLLLSHRQPADVDNGRFQLLLEAGSRQWGGSAWNVDLNIGRFDHDTGEYDGAIEWQVTRSNGRDNDTERVLAVLAERPFEMTKEEVAMAAGGQVKRMRDVVNRLGEQGRIKSVRQPRKRTDGRPYYVWAFGLSSDPGRPETADGAE